MIAVVDLTHRLELLERLESFLDYASKKGRAAGEELLLAEYEGTNPTLDQIVELALSVGADSWPARQAFQQFIQSVGQDLEWDIVLAHVSRPIAFLLTRRRGDGMSISDVLSHEESHHAFYPEHRQEIELVRQEAHRLLFSQYRDVLEPTIEEFRSELEGVKTFLKRQKEQAFEASQEERLRQLETVLQLEARIVIGGEWLPIELLRDELAMPLESVAPSVA